MNEHEFFLIVAPGLTDLAALELEEKWTAIFTLAKRIAPDLTETSLQYTKTAEGITLEKVPLLAGVLLNTYLKTPTRILLRLGSFRCRDFPKLYNKCKKMNLGQWLPPGPIRIKASASKSRLMMLKRIEDTVLKACSRKAGESEDAMLWVRFQDDTCTISVDTSGEALYKRTSEKKVGQAPLRETIAAALFYKLHLLAKEDSHVFIDPMLGSGTSLSEALNFWRTHKRERYAFLSFEALQKFSIDSRLFYNQEMAKNPFDHLVGYDQNDAALTWAKENIKSQTVVLKKRDVLGSNTNLSDVPQAGVLFANPPYGKRLKLPVAPKIYFQSLWEAIARDFSPNIAGLILPRENCKSIEVQHPYKQAAVLHFMNGGLKVSFVIYRKASQIR